MGREVTLNTCTHISWPELVVTPSNSKVLGDTGHQVEFYLRQEKTQQKFGEKKKSQLSFRINYQCVCKIKPSQIQKTNLWLPKKRGKGGVGLRDTNYYVYNRYAQRYIV